MIDPTDAEKCAMDDAGQLGGAYLQSLNNPGIMAAFAYMTKEQWQKFIEVICGGYVDSMTERQAMINRAVAKFTNLPG